jgi:hypothetical protein
VTRTVEEAVLQLSDRVVVLADPGASSRTWRWTRHAHAISSGVEFNRGSSATSQLLSSHLRKDQYMT